MGFRYSAAKPPTGSRSGRAPQITGATKQTLHQFEKNDLFLVYTGYNPLRHFGPHGDSQPAPTQNTWTRAEGPLYDFTQSIFYWNNMFEEDLMALSSVIALEIGGRPSRCVSKFLRHVWVMSGFTVTGSMHSLAYPICFDRADRRWVERLRGSESPKMVAAQAWSVAGDRVRCSTGTLVGLERRLRHAHLFIRHIRIPKFVFLQLFLDQNTLSDVSVPILSTY